MTSKGCYMSGTRIRTARGEVSVDFIQTGDDVYVYRDGQEHVEPVKWVGRSAVDLGTHAHVEDAAPIRFRKDALADNQPARDLFLSPEHCLIIDGLCVPAKLLVNGGSIVSERKHEPFTYFHLELDRHGMLMAENALAESYLDTGNRHMFDNADGPQQLHPSFVLNADSTRWVTDACAPLAEVPEEVEPIWRRLAERSEQIGYLIPTVRAVDEPDLHIVADGTVIRPTSDNDARYVFTVPASVKSVSLVSRFAIPADKMIASQRDTRRLGVRVNWIAIRTGSGDTFLNADNPGLKDGWNDAERDDKTIWRWTDGSATVPWDNVAEAAVLTVRCFPVDHYPVYDEHTRLVA
jgi:antigen 43